jgi:hypothetical protein
MADWSLTSLQLKLIKIGARVVRHARAMTFQLADVAITAPLACAMLSPFAFKQQQLPSNSSRN